MSSASNALSVRSSRTQNSPSSHGPCSVSAEPNSGKISAACSSSTRVFSASSAVRFASCSADGGARPARGQLIEIEVAAAHAIEQRALGVGVEPLGRRLAEEAGAIETGAVGIEQVDARRR